MTKTITVGNRQIGHGHPPFIIAEMSGNHNQSLDRALKIVEAAAKTGVQAMKIQTYTADTMTLPVREGDFVINDPKSLWSGKSLVRPLRGSAHAVGVAQANFRPLPRARHHSF